MTAKTWPCGRTGCDVVSATAREHMIHAMLCDRPVEATVTCPACAAELRVSESRTCPGCGREYEGRMGLGDVGDAPARPPVVFPRDLPPRAG